MASKLLSRYRCLINQAADVTLELVESVSQDTDCLSSCGKESPDVSGSVVGILKTRNARTPRNLQGTNTSALREMTKSLSHTVVEVMVVLQVLKIAVTSTDVLDSAPH